MKRLVKWIMCLVLMVLATSAAMAQARERVPVALEILPSIARQSVNLHEDQWNGTFNQTRVQINALAVVQRRLEFKYSLTPGFSVVKSTVPQGLFVVGSTDFGQKQQQGSQQQAKPVNLELVVRAEHRVEFAPWIDLPIRPVLMGQWTHLSFNATGEKDGKVTSDSEQYQKFFVGLGGQFRYLTRYTVAQVQLVGGPGFNRMDATLVYRTSRQGALTGGYLYESKDLGGLTLKQQGPFLGVLWAF